VVGVGVGVGVGVWVWVWVGVGVGVGVKLVLCTVFHSKKKWEGVEIWENWEDGAILLKFLLKNLQNVALKNENKYLKVFL
jgi:hypothetical protein